MLIVEASWSSSRHDHMHLWLWAPACAGATAQCEARSRPRRMVGYASLTHPTVSHHLQPHRAFHHLHAIAADMRRDYRAVLLDHARQQQARPAHVKTLADAQLHFTVARGVEIAEQR